MNRNAGVSPARNWTCDEGADMHPHRVHLSVQAGTVRFRRKDGEWRLNVRVGQTESGRCYIEALLLLPGQYARSNRFYDPDVAPAEVFAWAEREAMTAASWFEDAAVDDATAPRLRTLRLTTKRNPGLRTLRLTTKRNPGLRTLRLTTKRNPGLRTLRLTTKRNPGLMTLRLTTKRLTTMRRR